jgi:DNA-binding MarR family transcriptional regulator
LELTITQFTLLQALSLAGEISHGKLGEILAMDSTTLTRTLGTIGKHGWIRRRSGEDRRERYVRLSASGEAVFRRALPHWERAQAQLRRELGNTQWDNLMTTIHELTAAVAQ